jgi:deglycase
MWNPTSIIGSFRAMERSIVTGRGVRKARPAGGHARAHEREAMSISAPKEDHDMTQGRIACLLGAGFEDSEFRVPYDRLRKEGYQVDIIGPKAGMELKGYKGKETVKADKGIDEVRPEDYLGLLIPGGKSPDHLRVDQRFVDFVKRFDALKYPIAAVCHGPQLLLSARLARGRTLTAWPTVQVDLELAGANVKDEPVVIDQNWITSRKPEDLEMFSDAFIQSLRKVERATANGEVRRNP